MKKCKKCDRELSLSSFYKKSAAADGKQPICKECQRETNSKWRNENRDKSRESSRNWANRNKERVKRNFDKWRRNNLEVAAAHSRRYSAAKRSSRSEYFTVSEMIKYFKESYPPGNECYICGCFLARPEIWADHIHPISRGGADTLSNLAPCCQRCNQVKNAS